MAVTTAPRPESTDGNARGIGLFFIATLFFAIQDALTKQLTATLPAWQIVSVRFFFFSLFALAYAAHSVGIRTAFKSNKPVWQILRGILIVTEITLFSFTIAYMGLAEMHTVFISFPLIITALSVPLLGEKVGRRRWAAVAVGFVGTVIIIKPGTGLFNPYALLALTAAFMFSIYNILTRKLARYDSFETSLVYFGVAGFLFTLFFVPFVWQPVSREDAVFLVLLSASAVVGHFLLIKALQFTPAVVLQPFSYFVLVWAILIGFLVFGEILDAITLAGAAIVVGSGIFIARREYRISSQQGKLS